ncbi:MULTISPECIES: acireductone synthase [Protofrankia]|uniref:Enolase-phosphatase E1 n=1 Tax=Protofrankia coriariae TaxID=1562887 RepID=A0ABR5F0A3_9ACTN|nr:MULTISPECIES: acireductone synthase [Protofrankia]KLL10148.1 enolase [Protofrankia coriariae]ONH37506.1 2,3-diketo-5-methylthio-1-phosphopentane phosphatase [Protofrankia sp. BMG5.30]
MTAAVTVTAEAVVVDIEGTTSATSFVVDTLYPYSRARLRAWIDSHQRHPDTRRALAQVRELIGEPAADTARIVTALGAWLDADEKVTPLKTLQGLIWDAGFTAGELTSHLYPEVAGALRSWQAGGHRLYVFSSGSVAAQRAWFAHSPAGDLRGLFSGYFDTETAGPKRQPSSYAAITAATGVPAGRTVFLSDLVDELDAARAAGWLTVGVRRPGEPNHDRGVGDHPAVGDLAQIRILPPP